MSRPAPRNGQALGPRRPKVPPGVRSRPTYSATNNHEDTENGKTARDESGRIAPIRPGNSAFPAHSNDDAKHYGIAPHSSHIAASEAFAARRTAAGAPFLGVSSLDWRGLTAPPLSHSYAYTRLT